MAEAPLVPAKCLACKDSSGKMMVHTINRRAVGDCDVHIKITWSGICHSDIHTGRGEWGEKKYPLCVGHEILGVVHAIGPKVTKFKIGDIAGVGCFTDSCRECDECMDGEEQLCTGPGGMHGTYGSDRPEALHPGGMTHGGYSSDFVIDQKYTIKVPEKMHVAAAAPLLCAGITCFAPFMRYLKPGDQVGVIGLGGLGHMAVKIARAMGATVTVVTQSAGKKEMALAMGASRVVISSDAEEMQAAGKSLHLIYNSIAFDHDCQMYLNLLKAKGTMVLVGGVPKGAMPTGSFALIGRQLQIAGSIIGGIRDTQKMIDFCAEHDILCDIELIPATPEAVDVAWDRTTKSDVKFRFVIDTKATL